MQTTAAAFVKSFLDLEGELTPILVSLVWKNESATLMLDTTQQGRTEMNAVRVLPLGPAIAVTSSRTR